MSVKLNISEAQKVYVETRVINIVEATWYAGNLDDIRCDLEDILTAVGSHITVEAIREKMEREDPCLND